MQSEKRKTNSLSFLRPEEIINQLDVHKGMKVADFGCGAGYFAIAIAKRVYRSGTVYAIDIQKSALDSVRTRARFFSVFNIETIHGDLEKENGSTLKNGSVDMVLIANVLFQSSMKNAMLKEAKRILKKDGKIVVIEWNDDAPLGPNAKYRISKDDLKKLAKSSGLVLEKEFHAGSSHYGLVFSL